MSDSIELKTNGKTKIPWVGLVIALWSLFVGIFTWTVNREMNRTDTRLESLESDRGNITLTTQLRESDRKILEDVQREQARQGKLLAIIADRLNVREPD